MTTPDSFWDLPTPDATEVIREGGEPMLVPRGMPKDFRTRYTRASNLSSYIEDVAYIHKWQMRYLAKGMGRRPDLCELAAVEPYNTGLSNPVFGREKSQSGRRLDAIIERALDSVGILEKADRGTTIHATTEPGADYVPPHLQEATLSFHRANVEHGIQIVDTERFTANDTTMSAGTFDHLVRVHNGDPRLGGYVIADKKTGNYSPHEWAIQLSTYANGEPYNTDTDERHAWPGEINLDYAIVWEIDNTATPVTTRIHVLDVALGWEAAQHAAWVRDWHRRSDLTFDLKKTSFTRMLASCDDRPSLEWLWYTTTDPAEQAQITEKGRAIL